MLSSKDHEVRMYRVSIIQQDVRIDAVSTALYDCMVMDWYDCIVMNWYDCVVMNFHAHVNKIFLLTCVFCFTV